MKKLLCFILAIFIATSGSVSASELDFLDRVYTSYEENTSLTLELKQPLTFLKLLNSEYDTFQMFDAQMFFESLADMNMTAAAKVNISADYKKIQLSVEGVSSIPMQINRNLRLTADTKTGMWLDMDFSDDKNPKYTYIMQNPSMNKYMTADVIALMRETDPDNAEKSISLMKAFFNKDVIQALSKTAKDSLIKNSKMTKNGKIYTFTFDDKGIKQFYFDIFEKINPVISMTMDKDEKKEFEKTYKSAKKAVSDFEIVGKKGISMKYTLDSSGNISVSEISAEIDTNVFDFIKALFGFSADIKKEDCNINFVLNVKSEFKNVNKSVNITAPVITAENSFNLNEYIRQNSATPDYDYDDCWFTVETDTYKEYENGELAFPLRDVAEAFGIPKENISCSNGVITILGTGKGAADFKTAVITENSTAMTVDGESFELHTPVTETNGRALVDTSFIKFLFDADYSYGSYDVITGTVECSFERAYYDDNVFEDYEYDFDTCDDFSVYSESVIKADNGSIIMPVRDILFGFNIYDDSYTYENGVLTVSAKKPFKTLTATAGSNVINADGKEYTMNSAAFEKDGEMYVDISFAEKTFGVKFVSGEYDIKYHSIDCRFEKIGKLKGSSLIVTATEL